MYPFLLDLAAAGAPRGLAVAQLRYHVRGWNRGDPVRDVECALRRLAERHPGARICLIGHSMGARAVLRAAGAPAVASVAALAPWLPPGEPTAQLAGRTVLVVHGLRDRTTNPARSYRYAVAAREAGVHLARFEVATSGHAMLRRAHVWHALVRRFALASLGVAPWDRELAAAFATPGEAVCRIPA
jgi:dienelactone hydrolase